MPMPSTAKAKLTLLEIKLTHPGQPQSESDHVSSGQRLVGTFSAKNLRDPL
jgi:hypothetical protein